MRFNSFERREHKKWKTNCAQCAKLQREVDQTIFSLFADQNRFNCDYKFENKTNFASHFILYANILLNSLEFMK